MSEKHLTEPPWKLLFVKHKLKDTGLQKALNAYSKVDAAKSPELVIESLAEIAEQAAKLKKANQAIEELADYLDEVVKETARTKQGLAAALKPAEQKEEPESSDLKVRLTNALKKIKAADTGEPIAFVACVAKPCYGLLLAKSAAEKIGAAHKKILIDLTAGTKFIVGSCLFESNAHTFVVDPVPGGLAKHLKRAIKEITGQGCRVRVRDPEGKIVTDSDTEADGEEEAQSPVAEVEAAASTPAPAGEAPAAPQTANAEAMAKFTARFKALQPDILKAIATKTPPGDEVKQRATEAGNLANKNDFEQANRVLDAVETLLKKLTTAAIPPPPSPRPAAEAKPVVAPSPPAGAGAPAREIKLSTYLSGRANLRTARENAAKELQRLQQTILDRCKDEPFYQQVEARSQKLFDYLTPIDDAVVNKLDEAGKCLDPELQVTLNNKVRELIQKQLAALQSHPLASFVEKNPFGKFIIKQPLEVTLAALDKQLS